jgi:hypothetical protein
MPLARQRKMAGEVDKCEFETLGIPNIVIRKSQCQNLTECVGWPTLLRSYGRPLTSESRRREPSRVSPYRGLVP